MTGARSDPSESRDILSDHAYPLTNKDSEVGILEVVERFVSDKYSGSVGVVMMRDSENCRFLQVISRQSDRLLIDQSVLHLNISLTNNTKLLCQLLTYNRQLFKQTELDSESILEVGYMIEHLAKDKYKSCEGLALDQSRIEKCLGQLPQADICNLLVEKYDDNIVYRSLTILFSSRLTTLRICRSKRCSFIVDREEGEGGSGRNCPECVILGSGLQGSLNIIAQPQPEATQESPRKKRGRPKGSKTKQDLEDEDQEKEAVKFKKEKSEIQNSEVDDMESFQDDSEDYSPPPDNIKKPKFQSPPIPKSAKHFCPHDSCSARFVTLQQMKTHLAGHDFVHCGRPGVICPNPRCSSVFHSQQELEEHLPTHRDKRHVCSVCSKAFSTKQDLKIHSRTHSGKTFHPLTVNIDLTVLTVEKLNLE